MKHLVLGLGQVGSALQKVLQCDGQDALQTASGEYDVLNVCFPFQVKDFCKCVMRYREQFNSQYVVVHSTVPVGTCYSIRAFHSPVRGVHPNLEQSLRTFEKYLAYDGIPPLDLCESYRKCGIPIKLVQGTRNSEAAKLWDTTQYGAMILLEKEIHKWCEANKVDFDVVYSQFNRSYNEGYQSMGMPHYCRPVLRHVDGKIGGHCVVPNAHFLLSETAQRILQNEVENGD